MAFMDLPLDAPEKPNKGFEGGACNRRSCQAEPALWYNHGSGKWYCEDCKRDIGDDSFNRRDWAINWMPKCGHPMFETREMIDAREAAKRRLPDPPVPPPVIGGFMPYPGKKKSQSLERMLGKRPRRS